jgi:ferredoxin-NADP reductase
LQAVQLTISGIREEVKGFKTFILAPHEPISYKPGQYLTFIHHSGREEVRRSYSIVSTPIINEPLSIGVKRVPNGIFSRYLVDSAKVGDVLTSTGAGGLFVLPPDIHLYSQLFFFAAGSGITPILSLIKTALYGYTHVSVVLVYSNHSATNVVYMQPLLELETLFPGRFKLHFLFGDTPDLAKARLNRELLVELVQEYIICQYSKALFYICGPEAYMRMCTYALQEQKVPVENIRKENFIVESKTVPLSESPDKSSYSVKIIHEGKEKILFVNYPDTILKAAKKNGINLPYSCETGRCASCMGHIIKGDIWLSYNEVLTDKDIAEGLTLTCVGHPVNGNVEIEIP